MGENTEILKRRAPTLYIIIAIKLLKGALFVALAVTIYNLSDNDLPAELRHVLQALRFNPESRFWTDLAKQVGQISEKNVVYAAAGIFVYSLFSLIEGTGLLFRVSWAGWMAIGESAFFIPIEIFELVRHRETDAPHQGHPLVVVTILAINIFIVVYLYRNRGWLFKHHHHH
jgi:uncharacterized membrane protein (DUF2068 family)